MKKITLLLLFLFLSVSSHSQLYGETEGFETAPAVGPLPFTWSLPTGDWAIFQRNTPTTVGTGQSWGVNTVAATAYQGNNFASVNREQIDMGGLSEDWLATSRIDVPDNGVTELHFWTRLYSSGDQGTRFKVMIALADSPQADPDQYVLVEEWNELDLILPVTNYNVWTEKTVTLPAFTRGFSVFIAFVKEYEQPTDTIDGERWLIDNVGVNAQCTPSVPGTTGSITSSTATLNWSNPSGATQWEITVTPSSGGGNPLVFNHTGGPSFQVSGLSSNTPYTYTIKAICGSGFSSPASAPSATFTTQVAPPICGGNLVDSGGIAGNYLPNENSSLTVTPAAGEVVTVTFTAFNTQADTDILRIYDGPTAIAANLLATLSGTNLPPSYTSTAPNGELTFVFTSNGTVNAAGYAANISCAPAPACRIPTNVTSSSATTDSVVLNWVQPANPAPDNSVATMWDIVALPCNASAPNAGTVPTANDVTGPLPIPPYTLTGLASGTCFNIYVRAVCGGTNSAWSTVPTVISTLVAPPICGGNFVDTGGTGANYSNNENALTSVICPTVPGGGDAATVTFTAFNVATGDNLVVFDGDSATGTTLLATLSGTTVPPAFSSSHPSGCLTFVFTSNGSVNAAGWLANVTCAPQPACAAPTVLTNSATLHNSTTLTWTQPANPGGVTSTSFDIYRQPCGQGAPTSTTVPTVAGVTVNGPNPYTYTLTGLSPLTCYDVYIRSACGSIWIGPTTMTTLAAPPECGGNFVDPGGANGDYGNGANVTTVICPQTAGDVVTVTFTAFNTEATWDGLLVYNGNSTSAPQIPSGNGTGATTGPFGAIAGAYWGTTIPCPISSSSTNGCLTFVFRSDGSGVRTGWMANITCAPPVTCSTPTSASANTITHNSAIVNWTQPANPDTTVANTWDIFYQACGLAAPTASTVPTLNDVTGTGIPPLSLTGLSSATCYDVYIRAVCGTENSAWICTPATFTTLIAPPECGGNYVDTGGVAGAYASNANVTTVICPQTAGDVVTVTFTSFWTEGTYDGILVYDGNSALAPQIASGNGFGNVNGPFATIAGAYWGNLTGAAIPGPFTSSASNGCLTFVFRSDGSLTNPGFLANITCDPAPQCQRPNTLTSSQITATSAYLGWTEPSGNVTQWQVLILPVGSPAPLPDATGWVTVSTTNALFTGLTPGTRYTFYVRGVCATTGTSAWSTGHNFATLIINDNCDGAIFVPVNSDAVCNQIASGTLTSATPSIAPPVAAPCVGTPDDDVWFEFIATNSYLNVSLQNVVGSVTNLNFVVYSGECDGTFTQIFCSANNNLSGTLNFLTIGQTYYIRVYSNSATAQTVNFDVCISTPSTCTNSSSVCSTVGLNYGNTTGVANLGTIGCLTTSPNPTFFTIQIINNGPINYLLTQSSTPGGAPNLDVDYAAWGPFTSQGAACTAIGGGQAPLTGLTTGCSFSPASTETFNIANGVAGQFYVILITNFSDDPGFITLTQTNAGAPGAGLTLCCPDGDFRYSSSTYCKDPSVPNPIPTIDFGSLAGVFSLMPNTPTGLVFANTATGEIDLQNSAPGNYIIQNTLAASATCLEKTFTFTLSIVAPATATIGYIDTFYCKNITTEQQVIFTGTTGGTYSATPNGGLYINVATGAINPSLSSPGIYTVSYALPGSTVCMGANPSTQVEIAPLPLIVQDNIEACDTYTLPTLTVGNYFDAPNGGGNQIQPGFEINTVGTHTFYIYAISERGCINDKMFTVTINAAPVPTYTSTLSSCTTSNGSITVTAPVGTTAPIPANLFISEVTDATTGPLTYIEIFNGTGATVNLANYKLRTFNNGSANVTGVCDNVLTGTLANNSVRVISVGNAANAGGVIPNQSFTGCTGINEDDCIKLTTLTNTVIDVFGRTDGVAYTPLNQAGYTYRRLNTAVAPNTVWNAAEWTALDPEDYTNVGQYSALVSSYEYSIDNGTTYQSGTQFNNLAPGTYPLVVRDIATGCESEPIDVLIDAVGATPSVTTITYPTPVCQNSTVNPIPDTSAPGFTSGGIYTSDPSTGIDIDAATGEIDLDGTAAGTYDITYTFAFNPATCQLFSSTTFTIEITDVITPVVGFSYTTPICKNAQATLSPTLASNFTTGGQFSSTTGLEFVNTSTGVIDLENSTAGSYTITYTLTGNTCQTGTSNTFDIVINPVVTPVTTISYTSPVCELATSNPMPDTSAVGFTPGGTYTVEPATTDLEINPTTGEIDIDDSQPGTYTIRYTVAADPSICQETGFSDTTIVINANAPANVLFTYTTPVCPISQATIAPNLDAGFVTGGVFTISPSTGATINPSTGVITLGATVTSGTYDITYTIGADPATCRAAATSLPIQLVISPVINANVTFAYTTPVCPIGQTTLAPTLDPAFTTGGTFTANPSTGISIDATTGVITLANNATAPGSYAITYSVPQNNATCQALTTSTPIQVVFTAPTAPEVGFHYDSPVCPGGTANPLPILNPGFVTGGVFGPTTIVDPVTGEVDLDATTAGEDYIITYTLAANTTTCQSANNSQATISITAPILVDVKGGCQNKYILNVDPVDGSFDPQTATFSWENAGGDVVGTTQSITVLAVGFYTVTVTSGGCSTESAPFEVTNVNCMIQKGISANNDNFNDTFDLTGFDVKKLTIFNRYGTKVYSKANYVNEWGGDSDGGDELPDGTYFYVIDKNVGDSVTGWIYINRAQ